MQKVKVSVIVPSLNAMPYIKQCLDSIRIQTLTELEILCVDAGSEDGTLAVINEYAVMDNRIRLIRSDQKSYGYQVNHGIEAARGEYVGIVEPDDYIMEEMFEKLYCAASGNQLDFVKSNFYKFIDCLGRRYYQKWERSAWLGKREHPDAFPYNETLLLKETPQALVYGDHGNIWSGIYRREFLLGRQIRLHETPGASYQDTGFAILCSLEAGRVMFLKDCFYRYRQHYGASSVGSQEKHSHIIAEYAWIWEQMQERGLTDEISRSFYMSMKFHSYLWNYNRLHPDGRLKFLENLGKDQILAFDEKLIAYVIPEKEKLLDLWQGHWQDMAFKNERERLRREKVTAFLDVFKRAAQIVVVCAGELGVSILEAEKRLNTGKVCAVCDNAVSMQGQHVEGLEVVSVDNAVRMYPEAHFMIANIYHTQEIYEQIVNLGVEIEKISIYKEEIHIGEKIIDFLLSDDAG